MFNEIDKAIEEYEANHKVMRLDGGINMYVFRGMPERFKPDISPKGRKVRFLNKNGYDSEREYANKYAKLKDKL